MLVKFLKLHHSPPPKKNSNKNVFDTSRQNKPCASKFARVG